jgi:raffinose synthase
MTVGAGISVTDSDLVVLGHRVLHGVPENVLVTPASGNALIDGAFIGVTSDQTGSHRVFSLGKLEYCSKSLSYTFVVRCHIIC